MRIRMGARELVELGLTCARGQVRRAPYTRKDGVHVKASCVPDKGAPGKTPASKKFMPDLGPRPLNGWKKDQPQSVRRGRLLAKLRTEPCRTLLRKVNVIANVTADRETERKLRQDYGWLRGQSACKLKTKQT